MDERGRQQPPPFTVGGLRREVAEHVGQRQSGIRCRPRVKREVGADDERGDDRPSRPVAQRPLELFVAISAQDRYCPLHGGAHAAEAAQHALALGGRHEVPEQGDDDDRPDQHTGAWTSGRGMPARFCVFRPIFTSSAAG